MKKILFLFGLIILFAACGGKDEDTSVNTQQSFPSTPLLERIQQAQSQTGEAEKIQTVTLSLSKSPDSGKSGEAVVEIWLQNPAELPLVSVRSFLAFDPQVLSGERIEIAPDSPFSIAAPGESEFDPENGIAKIGLSAAGGKVVTAKSLLIAKVSLKRTSNVFTTVDFYDIGDNGHTLALAKTGDALYQNVLKAPSIPTLVFLEQQ